GWCFFFQADDGIRFFHVTGVQTCALPIWAQVILSGRSTDPAPWAAMAIRAGFSPELGWYAGKMLECGAEPALPKREGCLLATIRSEERRVGTERGPGGVTSH